MLWTRCYFKFPKFCFSTCASSRWRYKVFFFKKIVPFLASFSLFSSFQYTDDSIQMFNINKFLPMTWFEPRTSGIGSDHSTNWATTNSQRATVFNDIYKLKHLLSSWHFKATFRYEYTTWDANGQVTKIYSQPVGPDGLFKISPKWFDNQTN